MRNVKIIDRIFVNPGISVRKITKDLQKYGNKMVHEAIRRTIYDGRLRSRIARWKPYIFRSI